jgi:hypothetical protein
MSAQRSFQGGELSADEWQASKQQEISDGQQGGRVAIGRRAGASRSGSVDLKQAGKEDGSVARVRGMVK